MDKEKAMAVLAKALEQYRAKTYDELKGLVDQSSTFQPATEDGSFYQIQIQVFWDSKTDRDIRVIGLIDDGGWRAFLPLRDDFIMTPKGTFLDE